MGDGHTVPQAMVFVLLPSEYGTIVCSFEYFNNILWHGIVLFPNLKMGIRNSYEFFYNTNSIAVGFIIFICYIWEWVFFMSGYGYECVCVYSF